MAGTGSNKYYIFGIKIYLQDAAAQDTDIGLYCVVFGDNTSQYDITSPSTNVMRVTYDGTGTAPLFVTNQMKIGGAVTISGLPTTANNGEFILSNVTETYFDVLNPSVVEEHNNASVSITSAYQFRWIQTSSSNTTDTWKSGLIVKNGISPIEVAGDFRRGGNTAQWKGLNFTVTNAIASSTSFWDKLSVAGISISSLQVELIEFDTSVAHESTRANETIIYRGVTELPSGWTKTRYTIPSRTVFYKRNANLATIVDNDISNGNYPNASKDVAGEIVPITFGKFHVHSASGTEWTNVSMASFSLVSRSESYVSTPTGTIPSENTLFLVSNSSGGNPALYYDVDLASTISTADRDTVITSVSGTDTWIKVIEGLESTPGQYRKISSIASVDTDTVRLNMDEVFTHNIWRIAQGNTFIRLAQITNQYQSDIWPCSGFLNEDGNLQNTNVELYAYEADSKVNTKPVSVTGSDGTEYTVYSSPDSSQAESVRVIDEESDYYKLPVLGSNNLNSSNNSTMIKPAAFKNNIDTIQNFVVLPVRNIKAYDAADLSALATSASDSTFTGFTKSANGLYLKKNSSVDAAFYSTVIPDSWPNAIDRDSTTYDELTFTIQGTYIGGNGYQWAIVIELQMPQEPSNVKFDEVYAGVKLSLTCNPEGSYGGGPIGAFYLLSRRWAGYAYDEGNLGEDYYDVNSREFFNNVGYDRDPGTVDNIPQEYFTVDNPTGTNGNFWFLEAPGSANIKGYQTLVLNNLSSDFKYEELDKIYLVIKQPLAGVTHPANFPMSFKLHEACVMFRKTMSIRSRAYSFFNGRIANDTWSGRITSSDLLQSPIDILEHTLRLQNWSEIGATNTPGLYYADNALICTGSSYEGQFDHASLGPVEDFQAARQITQYEDAWSSEIVQSLCRQFFLCTYQDANGKENVVNIRKLDSTPTTAITLADIVRGSIGEMTEQPTENIFCQPVINYNMNYGSKKYDNVIRVTNAHMPSFSSSYVTGYTGTEAEDIWNRCHALWLYYRTIEIPPTEMTDCPWINTQSDAKVYLYDWLEWMGAYKKDDGTYAVVPQRRITFSIPYEEAMTVEGAHAPWHIGMHFLLTLPHETDNVSIQCLVEKVKFNLNSGIATVEAILFGVDEALAFYIKDTFESYETTGWADWKDTYQTQAEDPTNDYDIKKVF